MTTITRNAPLAEPGGWLHVVDLGARRVLARAPVPDAVHRAADTNPRGGLRGGRGVAPFGDRLALATNDRILVLDRSWAVERVVSHRWLGGIHDIAPDEDGVWVACADTDLVVRVDWDGRVLAWWHWRTDRRAVRQLGRGPLPGFARWADHRDPRGRGVRFDAGHVNAVVPDGDRLLVGLGLVRPVRAQRWRTWTEHVMRLGRRAGAEAVVEGARRAWLATPLAAIGRDGGGDAHWRTATVTPDWTCATFELALDGRGRPRAPRLVARRPCGSRPAHHALPDGDEVVVALSDAGVVAALDRRTGAVRRQVELPGELPFPRGLLRLPDGRLLVGVQFPAALVTVDLDGERIVERFELPDDQGESPYAIAAVPASFADPAGRLPATRAGWPVVGADASASV